MHDAGYLHRDLKPENIMIGQNKKASLIYLIDFGLAKRYIVPSSGLHVANKKNKGVFGTSRFLSKNANEGNEQCRADDLIALGYIIVCFFRGGHLPWDMAPLPQLKVDDKDPLIYKKTLQYQQDLKAWDQKYLNKKKASTFEELTEGMPQQFLNYFKYCEKLRFDQRPDYQNLITQFELLFKDLGYVHDEEFDWVLHKKKLVEMRLLKETEEKRLKLLYQ